MPTTRTQRLNDLVEACDSELKAGKLDLSLERSSRIASALQNVDAGDVGISDFPRKSSQGLGERVVSMASPALSCVGTGVCLRKKTTVSYMAVHETAEYNIGAFFLEDRGATIPLHDHPHMAVYSRLLIGELHVRSYDWVTPEVASGGRRAALIVRDGVFTAPADFSLLAASGGNIHTFRAVSPCVVLDVLVPPYSDGEGRPCTYFSEEKRFSAGDVLATQQSSGGGAPEQVRAPADGAWLVEIPQPADFSVGTYRGAGDEAAASR